MSNEDYQYSLTIPQAVIFNSTKKNIVVNAGRRFGKTWVSGAFILRKSINSPTKKVVIYIAPTLVMARNLMWDTWLKEHIPPEYIKHSNEQFMTMTFHNGSKLYCLSAENPERLRGLAADLIIVDECAMINEGFYDVVKPCLADRFHDGEALYISTPKGYNWFYSLYCKGLEEVKLFDCFQFTTLEGGNVLPEVVEEDRRTMSPKMFAQEYLASFETLENRIYYNFDRVANTCDVDSNWGKSDIHIGMDFNVNPMTAVISVYERGCLYIFDEIVEKGSNTFEMTKIIKAKYPGCTYFVYPDPTGNKRQPNAPIGVTDISILRKAGFIICTPPSPYASKDKWNSVNSALLNAKEERRVFIGKNCCPNLRKAFEGFSFKENELPDKSTGLDHISDAAAYLITYKFPAFEARVVKPKVLGV